MRILAALVTLLAFGGAPSHAVAQETCSTNMYKRADASLRNAADNWPALLKHHRAFTPCDDGALAEGYSDAVVTLLAHRWDQFAVFVALSERYPAFRRWAIRHIDATASDEDLTRAMRNSRTCIGDVKTKSLCATVSRAAADARTELKQQLEVAPSAVTPKTVARMIDKDGARHTVLELTKQESDLSTEFGTFDLVLDGVSSGDPRWLALVPSLNAGTDAATALALRISVAQALPRNPVAVLRHTSRLPWFRYACGYPMIEPTEKDTRAYFASAISALQAVRPADLQRAKRVCLAELMKAQAAL